MQLGFESKTVRYIPGLLVVVSLACFGGCGDVLPNTVAGEQETGPDPSMLVIEPAAITLGEAGTSVQLQFSNSSQYDLSVETSTTYATGPKDWLTVTPASEQGAAGQKISFDLNANRDIVPAGQWDAEVTMMAGGIRKTVMVSIAVVAVAASVESHDFGTSSAPLQFQVWNAGGGTLQYQVDGAPSWLAVDGGSGSSTGPDDRRTVSLSVNRTGMLAGTYGGQITIRPVLGQIGFSKKVDVTMTVPPTLTIQASTTSGQAPLAVDFTAMDGTTRAADSPGGGTLNWDFGDDTPVAHGSSVSHTFTSGGTFVVALSLTLAGGLGTVGCHQATVTVTQAVSQPGSLVVSPTDGLSASGLVGDTFTPGSKTYILSNPGDTTIAWTAGTAAPPWVTLSKTGGTLASKATDTVVVSINAAAASLAAGSYGGSVTFVNTTNHTGDTARSVALTVNPWPAQPGVLSVTPSTGLTASGSQGGLFIPSSVIYTLTNTGGTSLDWTAGKTQAWVTLSKTGGTLVGGASDTVNVSINSGASSLSVGSYSDTVTFTNTTNGSGSATRPLALTVAVPAVVLTPIARWDTVPYQRINAGEILKCGVVAFSANGVQRVRFSVNGLNPVDVTSMTYNDQSGVWEYWTPVAADGFVSDGPITLDATVVGMDGGTRALDRLTFYANKSSTRNHAQAWVAMTGDDSTGVVNDSTHPFKSVLGAAAAVATAQGGDAGGGRIYVGSGLHTTVGSASWLPCAEEWLQVIGSGAVSTTIAASSALYNIQRLKVSGCKLDRSAGANVIINSDSSHASTMQVWVDNCVLIGAGQRVASSEVIGVNPATRYLTSSTLSYMQYPTQKANFCRGLTIQHIGGDAFQQVPFVVNCSADDLDPYFMRTLSGATYTSHGHPSGHDYVIEKTDAFTGYTWASGHCFYSGTTWTNDNSPVGGKISNDAIYCTSPLAGSDGAIIGSLWTGEHSDCMQWYGMIPQQAVQSDNAIVYNARFTNARYQGFYLGDFETASPSNGMALVNVYLQMSPDAFGGSTWARNTSHLIWWHCSFMNGISFGHSNNVYHGFSAQGNLFAGPLLIDFARNLFDNSGWVHNHYVAATGSYPGYYLITPGTDWTTGDAQVNELGSPGNMLLWNRVFPSIVPADAVCKPRGQAGDIGAIQH